MRPEDIQARLLYRDRLMLVIDKPAGLPVHAGPSGGASLEDSFEALRFGLPTPPALAHRLDRDTSGCLVLGRHRKALRRLNALFSEGRVRKTYWALVVGQPAEDRGRIKLPLRKVTERKGWRMKADAEGQPAVTDYRVLAYGPSHAWLALYPRTGRTHQIRVHCAASGWPILGDPLYGASMTEPARQGLQLHARALSLPLYPERSAIDVEAPLRADMARNLREYVDLQPGDMRGETV